MFPSISLLLLWMLLSKSWVSSPFKLRGWGGSGGVAMGCPCGVAPSWAVFVERTAADHWKVFSR